MLYVFHHPAQAKNLHLNLKALTEDAHENYFFYIVIVLWVLTHENCLYCTINSITILKT